MIATPQLATARLALEPLVADHSAEAYPLFADPALYRYMLGEPPASVDALRDHFARLAAGSGRDGEHWANWLVRRAGDRVPVGWHQATVTVPTASIAWVTFPDHRHFGYAKEAAEAVIAWLAREGVREVEAQSDERNVASRMTAAALGFVADAEPIAETLRGEATVDRVYRLKVGKASG